MFEKLQKKYTCKRRDIQRDQQRREMLFRPRVLGDQLGIRKRKTVVSEKEIGLSFMKYSASVARKYDRTRTDKQHSLIKNFVQVVQLCIGKATSTGLDICIGPTK